MDRTLRELRIFMPQADASLAIVWALYHLISNFTLKFPNSGVYVVNSLARHILPYNPTSVARWWVRAVAWEQPNYSTYCLELAKTIQSIQRFLAQPGFASPARAFPLGFRLLRVPCKIAHRIACRILESVDSSNASYSLNGHSLIQT